MGDFFERIVDLDVTGEEAGPLARRMVDWMVAEGLITRETTKDAMYSLSVDVGYVPGPDWARAVADSSDPSWIPGPVAVVVGRDYHIGGQGESEADSATCPRCATTTVIIDYPESFEADPEVWQPFLDGIGAWKETGTGTAPCSACGVSSRSPTGSSGPGSTSARSPSTSGAGRRSAPASSRTSAGSWGTGPRSSRGSSDRSGRLSRCAASVRCPAPSVRRRRSSDRRTAP